MQKYGHLGDEFNWRRLHFFPCERFVSGFVSPLLATGNRHHPAMKNLVLLLTLLICAVAYVRSEQGATWNSWMVALGANGFVVPATTADSGMPNSSISPPPTAAPPAPVRIPKVGGLIKNGYFVAGGGYWEGDGTSDPSGTGLVVRLNPTSWTRIYQNFSDQGTQNSIEVTYRLSPGLTPSRDPADYTDISKRLQIPGFERYDSMAISPGQFYGTTGDPGSDHIACEVFSPQLGSTEVQDYQHDYPATVASATTTFVLAFPPGTGSVTLLTAFVTNR
jgi:hypothetical protein